LVNRTIMFCYSCGKENQDIAIFCKNCGAKIAAQDSISNTNVYSEKSSFFGEMSSVISGTVAFISKIIVSAIVSIVMLLGLIWVLTKFFK